MSLRDDEQKKFIQSPTRKNGTAVESVLTSKSGSYGELQFVQAVTEVSGDGIYGFIPSNFRTFNDGTGSAAIDGKFFKCDSGTSLADYGAIQSFRS